MSSHIPWGIEQSAGMLWVGPMRSDGEKVDDVVVGLSYDRDLTHAAKVRQQERARLIASAPELLAALEWLHSGKGQCVDDAAVIAKATGKEKGRG